MVLCTCAFAQNEQKNFYISNSSTRKCFKLSMIFIFMPLLVSCPFYCSCVPASIHWLIKIALQYQFNVFIYSTILLYQYTPFVYRIGTYLTNCHKIFSRGREYICVSYLSNTIHLNSLIKQGNKQHNKTVKSMI